MPFDLAGYIGEAYQVLSGPCTLIVLRCRQDGGLDTRSQMIGVGRASRRGLADLFQLSVRFPRFEATPTASRHT